ncbi:MAG: Rap1a/Tai family immunity protein, partial [Rhodocyclaceae bacterium]|nr:Rap1a/Tai family immunity protein [Rhodocyclaceae bacterium]
VRGARCVGYVSGFVDGYAVSDYLAEKVGVSLNAICIPGKKDLPYRLVLSVLVHLENLPPNSPSSTATLVAAALAKTFPCTDQLESMK